MTNGQIRTVTLFDSGNSIIEGELFSPANSGMSSSP